MFACRSMYVYMTFDIQYLLCMMYVIFMPMPVCMYGTLDTYVVCMVHMFWDNCRV